MNEFTNERLEIIINNLLCEICKTSDINSNDYLSWLELEVGMTPSEIELLKSHDRLPMPNDI